MALQVYFDENFVLANQIQKVDTATGTGAQTTFPLRNKAASQTGGSIQFDTVVYQQYLDGFTFPDSSDVTLSTAPPLNSQGVIPGKTGLNFTSFDQINEPGVASPANVDTESFWLVDDAAGTTNNIVVNTYQAVTGNPGIAILFQNLVTAAGASTTWIALACANPDGTIGTLQATGTVLYTDNYQALTSFSASAAGLATQLTVFSASGFYAGDYLLINPGGGTQETTKILSVNYASNILTTTGINYNHSVNENIFMRGRKFWAQSNIPVGSLAGIAQQFINLGLVADYYIIAR